MKPRFAYFVRSALGDWSVAARRDWIGLREIMRTDFRVGLGGVWEGVAFAKQRIG